MFYLIGWEVGVVSPSLADVDNNVPRGQWLVQCPTTRKWLGQGYN